LQQPQSTWKARDLYCQTAKFDLISSLTLLTLHEDNPAAKVFIILKSYRYSKEQELHIS